MVREPGCRERGACNEAKPSSKIIHEMTNKNRILLPSLDCFNCKENIKNMNLNACDSGMEHQESLWLSGKASEHAQNPEVWSSSSQEDSESFLCSTIMMSRRRKTFLSQMFLLSKHPRPNYSFDRGRFDRNCSTHDVDRVNTEKSGFKVIFRTEKKQACVIVCFLVSFADEL